MHLLNKSGSVFLQVDNPIADGGTVYRGANGLGGAAGTDVFGVALEAATAANDVIEVLPLNPTQKGEKRLYVCLGSAGIGPVAAPGILAGDVIDQVQDITTPGADIAASFTSPVAAADTLAQTSAADLHAKTLLVVVHQP